MGESPSTAQLAVGVRAAMTCLLVVDDTIWCGFWNQIIVLDAVTLRVRTSWSVCGPVDALQSPATSLQTPYTPVPSREPLRPTRLPSMTTPGDVNGCDVTPVSNILAAHAMSRDVAPVQPPGQPAAWASPVAAAEVDGGDGPPGSSRYFTDVRGFVPPLLAERTPEWTAASESGGGGRLTPAAADGKVVRSRCESTGSYDASRPGSQASDSADSLPVARPAPGHAGGGPLRKLIRAAEGVWSALRRDSSVCLWDINTFSCLRRIDCAACVVSATLSSATAVRASGLGPVDRKGCCVRG